MMKGKEWYRLRMKKQLQTKVFMLGSMSFFLLWVYLWVHDIGGLQRGVFFGNSYDWFMDFYNTIYYTVGKTPYTWGDLSNRNYLPLTYMLLYPLTIFYSYGENPEGVQYLSRYDQMMAIVGAVFLVISFGSLFYCLYKTCKGNEIEKIGILTVLFCSGITMFNFDRANTIILGVACTCVFLMTYDSNHNCYKHIGFVSLAIAAALKMFPALFGVLLIYKKRYKDALFTILYGLAFAILPFFWVEGNVIDNICLYFQALRMHTEAYAHGSLGLFSPTIFRESSLDNGIIPWLICMMVIILAKNVKENWKQILLLSLAILLSSGQQSWYCLLFLFYPIVLFLNDSDNQEKMRWLFLIGFILILSPLQYNFAIGHFLFTSRRVINTVCVVMYIYLIIESGIIFIKNRKINDTQQ